MVRGHFCGMISLMHGAVKRLDLFRVRSSRRLTRHLFTIVY